MNRKKLLTTVFSSLFLFSLLAGAQFIRLAKANFTHYIPPPQPAFTIRSDGSVDPTTAPIQRNGEIYTLMDDIFGYSIVIERDNVVLDGGDYTLQGYGNSTGIFIRNQNNVTVTKMEIRDFNYGIRLQNGNLGIELLGNTITATHRSIYIATSSHNRIHGNNITLNDKGIHIVYPGNNSIVGNSITNNNEFGVLLEETGDNIISENYIARNSDGILLNDSPNNSIIGNTIKENYQWTIRFEDHNARNNNNIIYHNYFINNGLTGKNLQVSIPGLYLGIDDWRPGNPNVWDDGEKGNYWSDYLTRYGNATEIANTGIGDTPFYINPNNIDHYPIIPDNVVPEFPEFPTWTPMLLLLTVLVATMLIYKRRLHRSISTRRGNRNCSKREGG